MSNDDITITAGDRIELTTDGGKTYKPTVGDVLDDGSLLAVLQGKTDEADTFEEGAELMLFFYRQSGRYGARVRSRGYETDGQSGLVRLSLLAEPQKEQRREYYRLPASLKTLVCQYTEDVAQHAEEEAEEIAYTNDISIAGVSLRTRQDYTVGERLLLKVYLNWPDENAPPLDIFSEVRRVSPIPDSGSWQAGFLFLHLPEETAEIIKEFVQTQQQKRARLQRLIDGD